MKKRRKKKEYSKTITGWSVFAGFVIAQECMILIFYAIRQGFTAAAAYLTAAVGLGEAIIGAALNFYIALCKSDHKEGGITYEAAKANDFKEDDEQTI